ncbi:tail protein X [Stenotrophomonas sp. CD2]|nr:tail protein X [Stenotrophomonas sp. CD2]
MARTYNTRDGDVVDRIAYAHYGEQSPAILRAVFDANPGLAARGAVLPAGRRSPCRTCSAPPANAREWPCGIEHRTGIPRGGQQPGHHRQDHVALQITAHHRRDRQQLGHAGAAAGRP